VEFRGLRGCMAGTSVASLGGEHHEFHDPCQAFRQRR
jgi:hypothetical protein